MTLLPKYLTIREAALALGISGQRVRQLIADGKFTTTPRRIHYRTVAHITRGQVLKRLAILKSPAHVPETLL